MMNFQEGPQQSGLKNRQAKAKGGSAKQGKSAKGKGGGTKGGKAKGKMGRYGGECGKLINILKKERGKYNPCTRTYVFLQYFSACGEPRFYGDDCAGREMAWYYDTAEDKCNMFYWSGCGVMRNFESWANCDFMCRGHHLGPMPVEYDEKDDDEDDNKKKKEEEEEEKES